MKTCLLAFILSVGFLTVQAQLLGGSRATSDDDKPTVDKAVQMMEETLKEKLTEEKDYKTDIKLSDCDSTKQVVNGLRYNLKCKMTQTYTCAEGANCAEKAPKTQNCSASVWMKAGSQDLQYVTGKEPVCVDSQ